MKKYFPKLPIPKSHSLYEFYLTVIQFCQNSSSKSTEVSELITLEHETNKYKSLFTLGVNCSTITVPLTLSIYLTSTAFKHILFLLSLGILLNHYPY